MYRNLSEYVARLECEGELVRITVPVDPVYEITEITDRMAKSAGGGKALLFENTGTAFPVVTNLFGSDRRIAMALGTKSLDALADRIDALLKQAVSPKNSLMDKLRMLPMLTEMSRWFPRTSAARGECQQVVCTGTDASLAVLPVLKSWGCDGGRFVTLPMVHTLDPETGVRNVGMYRMQLFDDRMTGMHWHIHKTGARHYDAYKRLGRRMPVSVALGGDPAYTYAATAPMPDNMDEYLLAGFLRSKPVKLVRCITNDIYIPADCDFVIEGYVDPSEEKVVEGDFGDHTGFYSLTDLYPRFHVTAVTHRRDAIYPATVVGIPPQEDAYIAKATERIFLAPIRLAVQPEVADLTMPTAGTAHNLAVVSIASRYAGQAAKVAQGLWGAGQMMFNKYLLIVPAATDVRNTEALAQLVRNADLRHDLIRSEGVLDVLDHATATVGFGGKLALDLTRDAEEVESAEMSDATSVGFAETSDARTGIAEMPVGGSGTDTASAERSDANADLAQKPDAITTSASPNAGVHYNSDYLKKWGLLIAFTAENAENITATFPAAATASTAPITTTAAVPNGAKYLALFDPSAEGLTGEELLWLAAANTDPRRDIMLCHTTLRIDARSKCPAVSTNPSRFPNVVTSLPAVIEQVDSRWDEYNIGPFIESPSRRYRVLLLSDKAEW